MVLRASLTERKRNVSFRNIASVCASARERGTLDADVKSMVLKGVFRFSALSFVGKPRSRLANHSDLCHASLLPVEQ